MTAERQRVGVRQRATKPSTTPESGSHVRENLGTVVGNSTRFIFRPRLIGRLLIAGALIDAGAFIQSQNPDFLQFQGKAGVAVIDGAKEVVATGFRFTGGALRMVGDASDNFGRFISPTAGANQEQPQSNQ